MATKKGIQFSGHYVISIDTICLSIYICTLYSKKLKGRTKSYFILFLKLNDDPTRCFSSRSRRVYPNGCNFELKKK